MKIFVLFTCSFLVAAVNSSPRSRRDTSEIDCDAISPEIKKFVADGIDSATVFMISKTYCPYCKTAKKTFEKIGFTTLDTNIVEVDNFTAKAELQDWNWCLTGARTFPRVWVNGQVVGGSDDTTVGYYSGELTKVAYEAKLRRAAEEFVDRGIAGSADGTYFVISKEHCPFCSLAKLCLQTAGIEASKVRVTEINTFQTHDQIKDYAGELTGARSTPRIWFNGKVIGGYTDLKAVLNC